MGIHDRDWYRDELRKRELDSRLKFLPRRRLEPVKRNHGLGSWPLIGILLFVAFASLLVFSLFSIYLANK